MEKDMTLIHQVQTMAGGEFTHVVANLTAAYTASIDEYKVCRDEEFRAIALECERRLRILLAKLRMRSMPSASRVSICRPGDDELND